MISQDTVEPDIKSVKSEGELSEFRIAIGGIDPTINTVVTDGKGGLMVQVAKKDDDSILVEGITKHELQHINDFLAKATNLEILSKKTNGQFIPKGHYVTSIIEKGDRTTFNLIERRGYRAEINYLRSKLNDPETIRAGKRWGFGYRLGVLENSYESYKEN